MEEEGWTISRVFPFFPFFSTFVLPPPPPTPLLLWDILPTCFGARSLPAHSPLLSLHLVLFLLPPLPSSAVRSATIVEKGEWLFKSFIGEFTSLLVRSFVLSFFFFFPAARILGGWINPRKDIRRTVETEPLPTLFQENFPGRNNIIVETLCDCERAGAHIFTTI